MDGRTPGNEESAGKNYSHRCPKGNRRMRRVLNQAANAAVKAKGTNVALVYRRLVPRFGQIFDPGSPVRRRIAKTRTIAGAMTTAGILPGLAASCSAVLARRNINVV